MTKLTPFGSGCEIALPISVDTLATQNSNTAKRNSIDSHAGGHKHTRDEKRNLGWATEGLSFCGLVTSGRRAPIHVSHRTLFLMQTASSGSVPYTNTRDSCFPSNPRPY